MALRGDNIKIETISDKRHVLFCFGCQAFVVFRCRRDEAWAVTDAALIEVSTMMRRILAGGILALGVAVSNPASANVIFNLSGVTLTGGGTLTGSFTLNDALNSVVSADIVASASGAFTGYTYFFPGATLSQSLPTQYLQLNSSGDSLRFAFSTAITATSATLINSASYESELSGGNRMITGGSLVVGSIPEPASVALFGVGLLGLVGLSHRRRAARMAQRAF